MIKYQTDSIAYAIKTIMFNYKRESIWYGDLEIFEEVAKQMKLNYKNPKVMISSMMSCLEKSKLFTKGYLTTLGNNHKKLRCFTIKQI